MLISKLITIIILILVVIGWRPQITSIFHCWIMYSFTNSATILDGGDHIGLIISLLILPISLTDNRNWHWGISLENNDKSTFYGVKNLIALSSLYIIKIQVAIIYLNSAVAKVNVDEWMNGTAIYYWFKHPVFGYPTWLNFILEPLILNGTSLFIICWSIILFEFTLFSGIFMDKKLKKYFLIGGIFFHLGIFIIHGLASFFFTMTTCLILYLRPFKSHFDFNHFHTIKDKIYDSFSNSRSNNRSIDAHN